MSLLSLREVDAKAASDAALLRLFELCRDRVEHVATTPLLPHRLAIATRNGFVQLVDLVSGEYRLFLTHLAHVPLDSSLRCFALVVPPSSAAAAASSSSSRCVYTPRQVLLYSLATSNELLLADVDSGYVAVLAACQTRPSVAVCDAQYLMAGEGGGVVTVWRAQHDDTIDNSNNNDNNSAGVRADTPPLAHAPLWRSAVVDDAVVCLSRCRSRRSSSDNDDDVLVCCSAAYACVVVDIRAGAVRATLSTATWIPPARAVAVLPLGSSSNDDDDDNNDDDDSGSHDEPTSRVVLCASTQLHVVTTSTRPATEQPPPPPTSSSLLPPWRDVSTTLLDVVVQCATCRGDVVVAGTASGVVLLFRYDAARDVVVERVRFDVGVAVVGVQLYANNDLLVVTAAGDVWRWPLHALVPSSPSHDDNAASATTTTSVAAVSPTLPSAVAPHDESDAATTASEPEPHTRQPRPTAVVTPSSSSSPRRDHDTSSTDDVEAAPSTHTDDDARSTQAHSASTHDDDTDNAVTVVMDDDDDDDARSAHTPASPSPDKTKGNNDDNDNDNATRSPPHVDSGALVLAEAATTTAVAVAAAAVAPDVVPARALASAAARVHAAAAADVTRVLGPRIAPHTAAQLRRGRRMPRCMIASVLAQDGSDDDDDNSDDDSDGSSGNDSGSDADDDDDDDKDVQLNSTLLLRAQYAALQQATFDAARDVDMRALDVQALQYRHPVLLPTYSRHDRVFDAVPPLLTTSTSTTAAIGNNNSDNRAGHTATQADTMTMATTSSASLPRTATTTSATAAAATTTVPSAVVRDDLMDATCLRLPHKRLSAIAAAARRDVALARVMPRIDEHGCDALLYGTTTTAATARRRTAADTTSSPRLPQQQSLLLLQAQHSDEVVLSTSPSDLPPLLPLLPLPMPSTTPAF